MELQPIRVDHLTLLESGQFINRQLTDIRVLGGPDYFTNAGVNDYLAELETYLDALNDAVMVVRKSDDTIKIEAQDLKRDQAFALLKKAATIHELSADADKRDAVRSLKNLFNTYKNLAKLNYEAESLGIDNLISDLGNSKYEPMVEGLGLEEYVSRLQEANNDFKALYDGRIQEKEGKETFDAKKIKRDMLGVYSDFSTYVLAMTKLKNSEPIFTDILNVLNVCRKTYADLLARRKGMAAETVSTQ